MCILVFCIRYLLVYDAIYEIRSYTERKKSIKNESTHIEQNRTAARFCNQTRNANKFFELSFGGFQQQNQ